MGTLSSALDAAFDEAKGSTEAAPSAPEPEASLAPTQTEGTEAKAEAAQPAAPEPADEPTGDVLLDKLTPDQIAEIKKDPRLKAIYKGLMSSYTPKMQQFAEQQRLWESLNNEGTRRQAVEAMARAVGLEIKPTDPVRQIVFFL